MRLKSSQSDERGSDRLKKNPHYNPDLAGTENVGWKKQLVLGADVLVVIVALIGAIGYVAYVNITGAA